MFGERVLQEIERFAWEREGVRAMVLTGSWARGEATEQSDVDVFLVAAEERDAVFSDLAAALSEVRAVLAPIPEKRVFLIGDACLKAEVTVIPDVAEMEGLYRASRVCDPCRSVPVDKDGTVDAVVAGWCFDGRETDQVPLIAGAVEEFLEGLELASRYAKRGDAYRFYYTYNEALAAYAALLTLKTGSSAHLDLPRSLVEGMDEDGKKDFRTLAGSLDPADAPGLLGNLVAAFVEAYAAVHARHPAPRRTPEEVWAVARMVLERGRMT